MANTALLILALISLAISVRGCMKGNIALMVVGQLGGVITLFAIILKLKMQC